MGAESLEEVSTNYDGIKAPGGIKCAAHSFWDKIGGGPSRSRIRNVEVPFGEGRYPTI
jgi:hypothetical protein